MTTLGLSGLGLANDGGPNEVRSNNNTGTSQAGFAGAGRIVTDPPFPRPPRSYKRADFALETNPFESSFSQSDSSLPLPTANSSDYTTVQAARSCINLGTSGLGLANSGGPPDARSKNDTGTVQDGAAGAGWVVTDPRLHRPLPPYKRTNFAGETNLFEFNFSQSDLSRARPMVNFKNSTAGPSVNENSNATTGKEVSNRFRNPADAGASAREQKASLKATFPPLRFIEQPTSEGVDTTTPAQAARPDNKRARPSSNSSTGSATSSALPTRRRRVMSARNDPGEQNVWNQPMGGT